MPQPHDNDDSKTTCRCIWDIAARSSPSYTCFPEHALVPYNPYIESQCVTRSQHRGRFYHLWPVKLVELRGPDKTTP